MVGLLGARLLVDAAPQREACEAHDQSDQERDAPAPGLQHFARHCGGQHGARCRPRQDAADRAAARHGADQAALVGPGMLDHEDDGGGVFAAHRQALDHAQQREQDRRRHAQRLVARQDADQEGRDRHRRHREGERGAPAETVADIADQCAAHGPHQEAHGEDAEGRQHLRHLVLLRKEGAADGGGEVAVDGEIVPFEHVADGAGRDDPACVPNSHECFPKYPQSGSRRAASGSRGSRSIAGSSIPTGEETVVDGARGGWPASRRLRSSRTS